MKTFVLGTSQLGELYGIANTTGKPDLETAFEIVQAAWEKGIRVFDTAPVYGESETVLGKCLDRLHQGTEAKIITKIDPRLQGSSEDDLYESVRESIDRLQVPTLHALLLHRGAFLKDWEKFRPLFERLKMENFIEHPGVSIYTSEEFHRALEIPDLDVIQLPFNIFDPRALQLGWFDAAKKRNKKIFVRSVYLQGLLLLDPQNLPARVGFAKEPLQIFRTWCEGLKLSPREAALQFVLQSAGECGVVVGAETKKQVIENIEFFNVHGGEKLPPFERPLQGPALEKLTTPMLWI